MIFVTKIYTFLTPQLTHDFPCFGITLRAERLYESLAAGSELSTFVTAGMTRKAFSALRVILVQGKRDFFDNRLFMFFVPFKRENLEAHTTELTRRAFLAPRVIRL